MTLSDKYKNQAISLGLCKEWTEQWKDNSSKTEMLKKLIKGNDFCILNDFPSLKDIRTDYEDYMSDYGFYVDKNGTIVAGDFVMLCGECDVDIIVDGILCDIYIRHNSKARINVKGAGKAFIRVHNTGNVFVDANNFSKAFVYDYCKANIKTSGNVTVRDKRKKIEK